MRPDSLPGRRRTSPRNGGTDGQRDSTLNPLDSDTDVLSSRKKDKFSPGKVLKKPLGLQGKQTPPTSPLYSLFPRP